MSTHVRKGERDIIAFPLTKKGKMECTQHETYNCSAEKGRKQLPPSVHADPHCLKIKLPIIRYLPAAVKANNECTAEN